MKEEEEIVSSRNLRGKLVEARKIRSKFERSASSLSEEKKNLSSIVRAFHGRESHLLFPALRFLSLSRPEKLASRDADPFIVILLSGGSTREGWTGG